MKDHNEVGGRPPLGLDSWHGKLRNSNWDLNLGQSPIKVDVLQGYLQSYINKSDAKVLGEGFQHGFSIKYQGPRLAREHKNLKSAFAHRDHLWEKIDKEVSLGRLAGPFNYSPPPHPDLIVSPVGLVPKSDGGGD